MIRLIVLFFAVVSSEPPLLQGYERGGYEAETASRRNEPTVGSGQSTRLLDSSDNGDDVTIEQTDDPDRSSLRGRGLLDPEVGDQLQGKGWLDTIPGTPGEDYPNYDRIPETSFSCDDKTPGGYYADIETRCQVFHVCNTGGQKNSFLCPNGSIFNQKYFVCDWWYDFECDDATDLYSLNDKVNRGGTGSGPSGPGPVGTNDNRGNDYTSDAEEYPGTRYQDGGNSVHDDYDLSLAGTGEGGPGYARNGKNHGYQSNVDNDRYDEKQSSGNERGGSESNQNQNQNNQKRNRVSKDRVRNGNGNQGNGSQQTSDYSPPNDNVREKFNSRNNGNQNFNENARGQYTSGDRGSNSNDHKNGDFNGGETNKNGNRREGGIGVSSGYLPPRNPQQSSDNTPRGFSSDHDQRGGERGTLPGANGSGRNIHSSGKQNGNAGADDNNRNGYHTADSSSGLNSQRDNGYRDGIQGTNGKNAYPHGGPNGQGKNDYGIGSGNANNGFQREQTSSPHRPLNRYLSPAQTGSYDNNQNGDGQRANDRNEYPSANGNGQVSSPNRQPNINENRRNGYISAPGGRQNGQAGYPRAGVKDNGYTNVLNSFGSSQTSSEGSFGEKSSSGPGNSYSSPGGVRERSGESDRQIVDSPNNHNGGAASNSRDGYPIASLLTDSKNENKNQNAEPSQNEPPRSITDGHPRPKQLANGYSATNRNSDDSLVGPGTPYLAPNQNAMKHGGGRGQQRTTGGLQGGIGNGYPGPGPNRVLSGSAAIAGTLAPGLHAGAQNGYTTPRPSSDTESSFQTGGTSGRSNGNDVKNSGFSSDLSRVQNGYSSSGADKTDRFQSNPQNGYLRIRPDPKTNGVLGGQGTTSLATKISSGTRAPGEITSINTGFSKSYLDEHQPRGFEQQQGYENGGADSSPNNDPFGGRINQRKGSKSSQPYLPPLSPGNRETVRDRQQNGNRQSIKNPHNSDLSQQYLSPVTIAEERDDVQRPSQSGSQQNNPQINGNPNGRTGSGGAGNIYLPPTGPGGDSENISIVGGSNHARIGSSSQERRYLPVL